MFLFAWKLKETKSPKEPILLPFQVLPKDCAASSTTRSLCRQAMRVQPVAVDRQAGKVDGDDRSGRWA